jgi:hypothetical protein
VEVNKEQSSKPGFRRNYDNLTDGDRLAMHVDEIFALYLQRIS